VVAQDRYAGLLVNMHCAGLYNRRYGTDPSLPATPRAPQEQAVIQKFLDGLEAQQRQLREQLRGEVPPAFLEDRFIWANYKLLQIYDRLSLLLCMPPRRQRPLGPAPKDYEGHEAVLSLRPLDEQTVAVTPYPFGEEPLAVSVAARLIPAVSYTSDRQLRAALAVAGPIRLSIELRAAG
jgi:hypothetical protein